MTQQATQISENYRKLLAQGIGEFNNGKLDTAMDAFKRAVVAQFGSSEPWFWIGRIHEEKGDPGSAAYSFFMACDMDSTFVPAKEALKRLGYNTQGGKS